MRGHNWVDANYQLADVFDMLHRLLNQGWWAHGKEGTRYEDPKPFPRPGVTYPEDERKAKAADHTIAYMEHYRAKRAEGA